MLIKRATLDAIVAGKVTLAFRRWKRPTVRAGGRLRTAVGVRLRHAGADPRIALRQNARLSDDELEELAVRLLRMDARTGDGAWTRRFLRLLRDAPATRAADLAAKVGMEKLPFKQRVRRLKELGLTESLDVGYRLSPRGCAVLGYLDSLR